MTIRDRIEDDLYRHPWKLRPYLVDDTASEIAVYAKIMRDHPKDSEEYQSSCEQVDNLLRAATDAYAADHERSYEAELRQELADAAAEARAEERWDMGYESADPKSPEWIGR